MTAAVPGSTRREFLARGALAASAVALGSRALEAGAAPALPERGYYLLPCRTPTLGREVYRELVDDLTEDGVNRLVLWLAGGFRSRKFPVTWAYNAEHENVRRDFMGEVIRHAQSRGIRCLLGFTPFGYDGVNRYALERPDLAAVGEDGQPVAEFGIHSWGRNLCPARRDSQRFMLDYAREMAFDFYPEADGLFVESSDYAICHCPDCGEKHFDHEFAFVQAIAEEAWARRPGATVVVYPHYFTGARLRFTFGEAVAAKQPFDPRFTLFFTPHSAALAPDLVARARGAWWWNEAPSRFDVPGIRVGARKARDGLCTGFLPSLECYTYVQTHVEFGEPWLAGRRQVPFGFGWLAEGASPYRELPMRAVRIATRELSADPDLADDGLRAALGRGLFGGGWRPVDVEDVLELCRVFGTDRDWTVPAPLTTPGLVRARREEGRLHAGKRAALRGQLARVRAIAARHRGTSGPGRGELARIARWLSDQWPPENETLLAG